MVGLHPQVDAERRTWGRVATDAATPDEHSPHSGRCIRWRADDDAAASARNSGFRDRAIACRRAQQVL